MATEQITVKMPADTLRRLDAMAQRMNSSRNQLVLEGLGMLLDKRWGSAHHRLEDLCGAVTDAPPDGATSDAWKKRLSDD